MFCTYAKNLFLLVYDAFKFGAFSPESIFHKTRHGVDGFILETKIPWSNCVGVIGSFISSTRNFK